MRNCLNDRFSISTHPPPYERSQVSELHSFFDYISTHTPLAGRDFVMAYGDPRAYISTHTPLAGRDYYGKSMTVTSGVFLLTRPLRGAT